MIITSKKPSVLVVDDHPRVLRFIEISLKLHGFEVRTADCGENALALLKTNRPDIMLLDIIMPGISGLEVLSQTRSFTRMPVIAFSASSDNHFDAIRLGANDFLTKPFEPDEMVRKIEAQLARC
jgi:DNA-binding response OmpR family regulator